MSIELNDVLAAERSAAAAFEDCNSRGAFAVSPSQLGELESRISQSLSAIESRFGTRSARAINLITYAVLATRILFEYGLKIVHLPLFVVSLLVGFGALSFVLAIGAHFHIPVPYTIALGLLSGFAAGVGFFIFIQSVAVESARTGAATMQNKRTEFQLANSRHQSLLAELRSINHLVALRNSYQAKAIAATTLRQQFESFQNRLSLINWRALRGVEFEQFLMQVFEHHGFAVSGTKATGDQGIDLIARSGEFSLGVQVKGYFNSVGNDAVQQAHAGKSHYRCTHSAVITNSVFTKSAKELARSVDCYLVDENLMPELIAGRLFIAALRNSSRDGAARPQY